MAIHFPGNTAFQVENEGGKLYVTFGGFTPPFGGVVDIFDTEGHLLTPNHFIANLPGQGPLENPWGITLAPSDFGRFSNDLLIGNVEGAGHINAFDPRTGKFLDTLRNPDGTPISIPGLWDLVFGGGSKNNGRTNQLFFDAGPNAADFAGNGLFGVIMATEAGDRGDSILIEPQPTTFSIFSTSPAAGHTAKPTSDPSVASFTPLKGTSEELQVGETTFRKAMDPLLAALETQSLWEVIG